ncbi:MAG: ABC transporter substrate-binding protein [Deltaproteobacteria bacterium]|nr:ABC transporter substrate-binding protein [Deltaproteobacteria bacterium]
MGMRRLRGTSGVVALCAVGCIFPDEGGRGENDDIRIGALLPFTGDAAATGTNIERALIMVTERINAAGGIRGRRVRLVAKDTHSDLNRGLAAARELVHEEKVVAIIGPEDEDLAAQMVPMVRDQQVVQISGGVTSSIFSTVDDNGYWFRTCPSAGTYASALVERISSDGVKRAAILYVSSEYGTGMSGVLQFQLPKAGVEVTGLASFQPEDSSHGGVVLAAKSGKPEAVILVAYPRAAASIVQEWTILGGAERWFLGHALKASVFVDNAPPGALEGAIGVAPTLPADSEKFEEAFRARWLGDVPLDQAFFYYDAAALVVLSIAAATGQDGKVPPGNYVRDKVRGISRPTGTVVTWNELDTALRLVQDGEDVDYRGASGPVDLDERGDLEEAKVGYWHVASDRIHGQVE